MRLFSYVIEHDFGFAPNPFHGFCTLACCKPVIRRCASVGDYIVGTGGKKSNLEGHVCYWMRVDEIVSFDEYWADERYRRKKPNMKGSRYQRFGDNIYRREEGRDEYLQSFSFHSLPNGTTCKKNVERDTGSTDRVLIGREFTYWGQAGIEIPEHFKDFVKIGPAHLSKFDENRKQQFMEWLLSQPGKGYCGEPGLWRRIDEKPSTFR